MERTLDFNEKRSFICDMDGVIYHGNPDTYAYRPTAVLSGVGEIVQRAHATKEP